jgi:PAS domain S-box-containing protein
MNKTASILVLHDEPETLRGCKKNLNAAGHTVFTASTGRRGLQLAREKHPDLVLVNARLPDLGGMEVCKHIKSDSDRSGIFVILISSGGTDDAGIGGCLECGADVFLLKPLEQDELPALIQAVTHFKNASASPRNNQGHQGRLMDIPPDAFGLIHPEGWLLAVNAQAVRIFGCHSAWELVGKSVFDLAPASEHERIKAGIAFTLQAGVLRDIVFSLLKRNGDRFDAELNATVALDAKGRPGGLVIAGRDVTGRKQAERNLRASDERFRQVMENISGVFWMTDIAKNQMIYISPAYEKIWGRTCESLYASPRDWLESIHPDDRERVTQAAFTKQASSQYDEVYRIARPDGSIRWIHDRGFPVRDETGRAIRVVGIAEDITQRKESHEALRDAENRYFSIFENATEGIFLATPEGRLLVANPALARMLGYESPQQLVSAMTDIGRQIYVHPERRAELQRELKERGSIHGFEAENYRKDGSVLWVSLNAHVVRDASGGIQYFEGTVQDITQRKLAEAQVTILAHAIESTTEMIGITDLHGRFIFVNRAFQKAHGYSEAEILGQTPEMLLSPNNPPGLFAEAFEQLHLGAWRGEAMERRKDGTEFPVSLSTSQINNSNGKVIGFMMVARDITQQKRLEKEVLDISAIEQRRIGFNLHDGLAQHLTGIAYRAKTMEDALAPVDAIQAAAARKIVDLINEAIKQTRQLAHSLDPTEVEANGLIAALKKLSEETSEVFPVKCRFTCAESQLPLAPQTNLALFRIAQEAVHNAIVRGGAEQIELELTLANGRVTLAIRDNGRGFNPSKQSGAGMGLRLMQYRAHSINAAFQLTSHPGAGTVVQCSAPVASSVPAQPKSPGQD